MFELPQPRQESGSARALTVQGLLRAARSVHESADLAETLAMIARGVVLSSGFGCAVVNMVQPDGSLKVMAIDGGDDVRAALDGVVIASEHWRLLLEQSKPWGELRFIHHSDRAALSAIGSVTLWRPDIEVSEDPDRWHPDDMLFVPLVDRTGATTGMLSVDLPLNGLMPTQRQCDMLMLFALHAGVAIEHALIYQELSARAEKLEWAATHDQLTGLSNRSVFEDTVPRLATTPDQEVAVLVIDLNDFKLINDAGGHQVGDALLRVLAQRMKGCVRDGDVLARTGGDEFVVVATAQDATAFAEQLAERLISVIEQPVQVRGNTWRVGVSVGMATDSTPTDYERLLATADTAMYEAKHQRH